MKKIWLLVITLLAVAPLAAQETEQDEEYRVRFTDTLDVIGQEFDASVACLAQANALTNANQLEFGQTLVIPADCDPYDPIESDIIANLEDLTEFFGEDTDPGQGGGGTTGNYRVRYGDTIDVIAQEFDVSVACLVAANDLVNANNLSFGQMLTIPDNCDPYDDIESVILSNIEDLEAAGFTESDLGQGGGAAASTDEESEAQADEPQAMGDVSTVPDETYVVEANDNLTQIAEAFGVTLACLQRTNGIVDADLIYPGQELLISGSCQAGGGGDDGLIANRQCQFDRNAGRTVSNGVYVVQAGDTLDFIGCDLNMNTLCLADINDLENRGRLIIGQSLTISSQCAGWVAP